MGQDWRRQIAKYAHDHIKECRGKGQGTRKRFPATKYRGQKRIVDAVGFLNGWLRTNYSAIFPELPLPPENGYVPRKEWTAAWARFYDEHLGPMRISLNELVALLDADLDGFEGQPVTDTAHPVLASGTQTDELSWLQLQLDELQEVLREHLAQPRGQGHPELIDLQDEALEAVLNYLDKLLSGEVPEALPAGVRGGSDLLTNIEEVIKRFAEITGV